MIDKREILEAASSLSLLPNIVEKDYVLGWIIAGINAWCSEGPTHHCALGIGHILGRLEKVAWLTGLELKVIGRG
jgi:L-arabinose isomerase